MNDQPLSLLPICQTEDTAKAPNTVTVWVLWETAILLMFTIDQCAMLLSHHNWEINYLQEYAVGHHSGWASYFTTLDEGELLNVHWDPLILLQVGPVKMYHTRNGTCTIKRGEKKRIFIWRILPSVHLLMSDSAAFPGQHA